MMRLAACAMAAGVLAALWLASGAAHAQNEDNIPFHEIARVVLNATEPGLAEASVTLQSTSTDDMLVDPALAARIAGDDGLAYIALTNEGSCVIGVTEDESCVLVSVLRHGEWDGIEEIQRGAREIGDSYIDDLNEAFDTRAQFHSVFIHYGEEARLAQAADRRIVSAVYTMPREETASMYEKVGGILLSPDIRSGGGFYEASRRVIAIEGSHMLFSITPIAGSQLMQMRISAEVGVPDVRRINPLELLRSDPLERSDMFSRGYNPLGSIVQAVVISEDELRLASSSAPILPTRIVDNEHVPLSVRTGGWIFDPASGNVIKGTYIFGGDDEVEDDAIVFALAAAPAGPAAPDEAPAETPGLPVETIYALGAAIAAIAAGAWLVVRRRRDEGRHAARAQGTGAQAGA